MTGLPTTRLSRGGTDVRRGTIGVLLAALLATMATVLTWVPGQRAAAATAIPARTTWVQGDSVLLGALDQTRAGLSASGWRATVNAFPGMSIPAATDVFRLNSVDLGSVVVVELGNNFFGDPAVFAVQLDAAMAALQGRHVIWMTDAVFRQGQSAINDQIWVAASRWQNLEVADWASVVAADPALVYADGLHLTPPGYTAMAGFVLQRLNAWYGLFAGPSRPVVVSYGAAASWAGGKVINGVPTGMAALRNGSGAWLVASDGGVFTTGNAPFLGSAGGGRLNAPVVGIAATGDGGGYWLVAADGGVFTFGDARFFGSAGFLRLNRPVAGMAAAPDGGGYWLVASDGGVFTFGDAPFLGSGVGMSSGGPTPPAPSSGATNPLLFVGVTACPNCAGYWLLGVRAA